MTTTTPQIGDFGLVPTYGSGVDKLAGELIRWGTDSPVNHAFVVVGLDIDGRTETRSDRPRPRRVRIVEAEPAGAQYAYADKYDSITWSTGRLPALLTPTDTQRAAIVKAAGKTIGTPYGWEDIVAIALGQHRTGDLIGRDSRLAKIVSSRHELICSQLVDVVYGDAGVHLFDDGRQPGMVSPGDLYRLLLPEPLPARLAAAIDVAA